MDFFSGNYPSKKRSSSRFSRLTWSWQGETSEGRIKFLSRDIVAYIRSTILPFIIFSFFFFLYDDSMNFINAFEAAAEAGETFLNGGGEGDGGEIIAGPMKFIFLSQRY